MNTENTALVIGATGGIGGEVARTLQTRGWKIRGLHRDVEAARRRWKGTPIQWVAGDAMNREDVVAAAKGASLIFHGANPPGYRNWAGTVVQMLDNTIAAARAAGARIAFPGTVYNFGPDAWPLVDEEAPQNPKTRKGRLRVAMEARLRDAAVGGVPVLIVRAGDYFGPNVGNGWLGQGIVTTGKPVTSIRYPGKPDAGHAWAYLPDLAETFARLIDRIDTLPAFARFHFRGHYFARGIGMAEAVREVAGRQDLRIGGFPWPLVYLAAPFVTTFREVIEMRYLWSETLELDNRRLLATLGEEPHTPIAMALAVSLKGMGCLPPGS